MDSSVAKPTPLRVASASGRTVSAAGYGPARVQKKERKQIYYRRAAQQPAIKARLVSPGQLSATSSTNSPTSLAIEELNSYFDSTPFSDSASLLSVPSTSSAFNLPAGSEASNLSAELTAELEELLKPVPRPNGKLLEVDTPKSEKLLEAERRFDRLKAQHSHLLQVDFSPVKKPSTAELENGTKKPLEMEDEMMSMKSGGSAGSGRSVKEKVCPVCKVNFASTQSMMRHAKRKHPEEAEQIIVGYTKEDDLPFTCATCSKSFAFESSLKMHARRHESAQQKFVCATCGKGFILASELRKHFKFVHEKEAKADEEEIDEMASMLESSLNGKEEEMAAVRAIEKPVHNGEDDDPMSFFAL